MYGSIFAISCFALSSFMYWANDDPSDSKGRIRFSTFAEEYARQKFSNLEKHPDLEKLFADFSSIAHLHAFMRDEATKKLYQDIIIAVLEKDMQDDVLDATFATFLLQITPPEILLEAVVPELGPKGRLNGILNRETADVRKRLEGQSPQGYAGEPDFRHYASYLKNHKHVESSVFLIAHIFKSAPAEALHAMIYVQYLQVPYPPLRLSKSASVNADIRPLVYAEHIISDVIWHEQFHYEIMQSQLEKARNELNELSKNRKWWVRLYAAEIMRQYEILRTQEAIDRLKRDKKEEVSDVVKNI